MKKLLIAGASSAVLAAMPVVGVFADQQDTIRVQIQQSCTVGLVTDGHTPGVVSSANGAAATSWSGNELSGTMTNGTYSENYGKSNLTVSCNKNNGFVVSATQTALNASTLTDGDSNPITIPAGTTIDGTVSNWAFQFDLPTTTSLEENTASTENTWLTATSKTGIVKADTPVSNGTFEITYGVSVSPTQPADTYSGTITYVVDANS